MGQLALCDEHVGWRQPLADLRAERDHVPIGADVALAVKRGKAVDHQPRPEVGLPEKLLQQQK